VKSVKWGNCYLDFEWEWELIPDWSIRQNLETFLEKKEKYPPVCIFHKSPDHNTPKKVSL